MYRIKRIDSSNISDYEHLFLESYSASMRVGKLSGRAVYGPDEEKEELLMVYVMTVRSGWMELVWLDVYDRSRCDAFYAGLFRAVVRKECFWRKEPLEGVFAEFYTSLRFRAERIRNVMIMSGMESIITKSNIYEFRLSDVEKVSTLQKATGRLKCISLSKADETLFEKLDELLQQDTRPSPMPLFVNWDAYLREESLICMKAEEPCGLLLFSRNRDSIVIDCAFVTEKLALACMLWTAYEAIKSKYGAEQKILVPVVVDRTASIVERLVPTAERGDVVEAIMRLGDGRIR